MSDDERRSERPKEKPLAPVPDDERERRLAELDRELAPEEAHPPPDDRPAG